MKALGPNANESVGRKVGGHCGKQYGISSPPIIKLPYDSAVSCLGFCPKEQKEDPEQTDTLSKPFTATVVTEARAEASQMSTRRCADEQSMLYRNKKILVSLKKGRDSTACRSMD